MIVFHGTRHASAILADGFRASTGGEFGPGIYFSASPDTAAFYALRVARGPEQPTILRTRVHLRAPFRVTRTDWIRATESRTPRQVGARLARKGHDGIVGVALNGSEQIVVWESSSITREATAVHAVLT